MSLKSDLQDEYERYAKEPWLEKIEQLQDKWINAGKHSIIRIDIEDKLYTAYWLGFGRVEEKLPPNNPYMSDRILGNKTDVVITRCFIKLENAITWIEKMDTDNNINW